MEIKRAGSQASRKGPAEWFTGSVRIDPLFEAPEPALVSGASVTFEPGARTAWHTHPLGQVLIVTAGCGWVQREGGPIEEIRPGDVVWFAPGEKHWHGATANTALTHIAIQERRNGQAVEWMEHVTDEQYGRGRWSTWLCGAIGGELRHGSKGSGGVTPYRNLNLVVTDSPRRYTDTKIRHLSSRGLQCESPNFGCYAREFWASTRFSLPREHRCLKSLAG